MPLLDSRGNPIVHAANKAPAPKLGEAFAPTWAGDADKQYFRLPGGALVMFDLTRLTLADYRTMRDHYQINASLAVMTFMIHQMDWKIVCDNKKIADAAEKNIRTIWTPLVRALSQAFWAGFSPNILQWENDLAGKSLVLTKVKDQLPEDCRVNWKLVDGWAPPDKIPPKVRVYDGIIALNNQYPIPSENTLWYPLLMENGDYFGRKLLKPAFVSWYFSILVHLFSNRYFERFGEPVPVGRAPYDETVSIPTPGGTKVNVLGVDLMSQVLQNLRNRSVVVLPNDRSMIGTHGGANAVAYDYEIEYLESQMRGADFERYLMRLDEEISLALFTPLLILRTADVGSYNLGSTHWNMYLNMLNAIVGDMKYYLDNFILSRFADFNYGVNSPRPEIVFRKMGDDRKDVVMALLQALVAGDMVKPDVVELGAIAGLSFSEVKAVTGAPQDPNAPPATDPAKPTSDPSKTGSSSKTAKGGGTGNSGGTKKASNSAKVITSIADRTVTQINKWLRERQGDADFEPSFGHERQLELALTQDGAFSEERILAEVYRFTRLWIQDLPESTLKSVTLSSLIEGTMTRKVEELLNVRW